MMASDEPRLHIVVTGGNGYIGRRVVEEALSRGLFVTALGRRAPAQHARLRVLQWRLGEPLPPQTFLHPTAPPPCAMIHLAHDWTADNPDLHVNPNTEAARILFASRDTLSPHLRIVFGSSLSSNALALNQYGASKWKTEQMLRPSDVAARIGLVYGGRPQGQYGTLCKITGLSPVLPMIEASRAVQPIHVDEVTRALLIMATSAEAPSAPTRTIAGEPIPFGTFLETLARKRHGKMLRVVGLSTGAVLVPAGLVAKLTRAARPIHERLLGLAGTRIQNSKSDMVILGVNVAPLSQGLDHDDWIQRRRSLEEAVTIMSYVRGGSPSRRELILYARTLRLRGDQPLVGRRGRLAIRLIEATGSTLTERLDLGMRIAESTSSGGVQTRHLLGLAFALLGEVPFLLLRAAVRKR